MNSFNRSIVYLFSSTMIGALTLSGPTAAAPSGRLAIMNAHSNLCLTRRVETEISMTKSFSSTATATRRGFGALLRLAATWWKSRT